MTYQYFGRSNYDVDELPDLDVDISSFLAPQPLHETLKSDSYLANKSSSSNFQRRKKRPSETTANRSPRSEFVSVDSGNEEEKETNEFKLLRLASRLAGTGDDVQSKLNNNNKISKYAEHHHVHDSFVRLSRYSKDDSGSSIGAACRLSGDSEDIAKTCSYRSDCTPYEQTSNFSETVTCKSKRSAYVSVDSGSDDDDNEFRFLPLASRIAGHGVDVGKKKEPNNHSHDQDSIGQLSHARSQSELSSFTSSHQHVSKRDVDKHQSGIITEVLGDIDLHQRVSTNDYTVVIDKKKRPKALKSSDPEVLVQKTAQQQEKDQKLKEKELLKVKRAEAKRQRDKIKMEQEFEKSKKRILQESVRSKKPGECIKHLSVVIDLRLVNEACGPSILEQLQSAGVKYEIENQVQPNIITFWRTEMVVTETEPRKLATSYKENIEKDVLLYIPLAEFLQLVNNYHKDKQGMAFGACSLTQFAVNIRQMLDNCCLTLLVLGIQAYYKTQKVSENRAFRQRVKKIGASSSVPAVGSRKKKSADEDDATLLGQMEVEEALLNLQFETGICIRFVESSAELAKFVLQFAKAIAQRPFKLDRYKSAGFNMFVEGSRGVRVLPDGTGLTNVWRQQLQQFKNVSTEVANAIVAVYPSPRALYNAYKTCSSKQEGESLLEDIVVRRGAGIMATTRRVGKELSRKIHMFMTSSDPNQIIK